MTIRVCVDGTPYVVLFSGAIEISRMNRLGDLAICRASDDAKVWGVAVDAREVERGADVMAQVEMRMRGVLDFWHGATGPRWAGIDRGSSMGGSNVRAGYD